ncbi:MAG: retroviral-like aspartic protease [Planctomycetes bacterium]|nr:retroviral-like aspartic protease [Planctomycetota bacterium]
MGLISKRVWLIGLKGRRKVEALFGTGSSHSLLNERIARAVGTPEGLPGPKVYQAAVGSVTAREGIFADVVLRGKRLTAGLKIVPDLTEELILGADFMQVWHIRLEPRRGRVILDPRALRLKAVGLRGPRL